MLPWLPAIMILAGCRQDPAIAKAKYFDSGNRYFESKQYAEATLQYGNAVRVWIRRSGKPVSNWPSRTVRWATCRAAFPEYMRAADLMPESGRRAAQGGKSFW
jgi:hypothetical protein